MERIKALNAKPRAGIAVTENSIDPRFTSGKRGKYKATSIRLTPRIGFASTTRKKISAKPSVSIMTASFLYFANDKSSASDSVSHSMQRASNNTSACPFPDTWKDQMLETRNGVIKLGVADSYPSTLNRLVCIQYFPFFQVGFPAKGIDDALARSRPHLAA